MENYEVYGLSCSCHPEDGFRYIGMTTKGANKRLASHKSNARSVVKNGKTRFAPVLKWIIEHGERHVTTTVLYKAKDLDDLCEHEYKIMEEYEGDLLNVERGGIMKVKPGSKNKRWPY